MIRNKAIEMVRVDTLTPHPENARRGDRGAISESIEEHGFYGTLVVQESTRFVLVGNHRMEEAASLGEEELPVAWIECTDEEARRILLADNRANDLATYDDAVRIELLSSLLDSERGLAGTLYEDADLAALIAAANAADEPAPPPAPSLADRFLVPPFSVLDARQGYWQERRRQWLGLGIRSEEGRPKNLLKTSDTVLAAEQGSSPPNRSVPASDSGNDPQFYYKKRKVEKEMGRELTTEEFLAEHYEGPDASIGGTSIFDPVLCEVAYRWWSPLGGLVFDPFAGGSVRGVVAAMSGRQYCGIDLRAEQVAANREQASSICAPEAQPEWHVGDSLNICEEWPIAGERADLIFTCPPYFDLEQYSDDPLDLSNAEDYKAFIQSFQLIIARSLLRLAEDRFAVIVVGEIRDPKGIYRGLVPDTIAAFHNCGASFYNEGILVTPVGSLALRAARIFTAGRKLAKGHQNVLVFCKGDPKRAAEACGPLEVVDPAEMFGELVLGGDGAGAG